MAKGVFKSRRLPRSNKRTPDTGSPFVVAHFKINIKYYQSAEPHPLAKWQSSRFFLGDA